MSLKQSYMKLHLSLLLILFAFQAKSQTGVDHDFDCDYIFDRFEQLEAPTLKDTLLALSHCHYVNSDFLSALSVLDSSISLGYHDLNIYLGKAVCQLLINPLDTSYLETLRAYEAINPSNPDVAMYLADFRIDWLTVLTDSCSSDSCMMSLKEEFAKCEREIHQAIQASKANWPEGYELLYELDELGPFEHAITTSSFQYSNEFDTTIIIIDIRDCGEFGGHHEIIECFRTEDGLNATFYRDSITCSYRHTNNADATPFNAEAQNIDSNSLESFVHFVLNIDRAPGSMTNAPVTYWIIQDEQMYYLIDHMPRAKPNYMDFRMTVFGF